MGLSVLGACRLRENIANKNVFNASEPGRAGCVLALVSVVFFGGRPGEPAVLDRFCSESTKHVITFAQRSRIDVRRHRQK